MSDPIGTLPRRVCWLLQGTEGYGVQRAALNLMVGLKRAGHMPLAVCLGAGPMAGALRDAGIAVQVTDLGPMEGLRGRSVNKLAQWAHNRGRTPQVTTKLTEILRGRGIDAVHFLSPVLVDLGGRVAKGIGAAAVWEMTGEVGASVPLRLSRYYLQWICRRHRVLVLANSEYTARTLGSWLARPRVFHLGVDARTFDPTATDFVTRAELAIPESAVVLGIVARLHPHKGQDRVIEAMHLLGNSAEAPVHLLLVGGERDDAYARRVRDLIHTTNLVGRVHLLGNVSDPQRYYRAISIPLNSILVPEGFGLSVVEAMMMARPPIVHALGGPVETVKDGQTGWHVHEPTAQGFAAGIRRALADRSRWPEMRRAARAHALAGYTLEKQTERYLAALIPHLSR